MRLALLALLIFLIVLSGCVNQQTCAWAVEIERGNFITIIGTAAKYNFTNVLFDECCCKKEVCLCKKIKGNE